MFNLLTPIIITAVVSVIAGIFYALNSKEKLFENENKVIKNADNNNEKHVAKVLCHGDNSRCQKKYEFDVKEKSCISASLMYKGDKKCSFACLGYGDCVKICPENAITITEKGLALINEEKCTACGKCVDICPEKVIKILPYKGKFTVYCSSKDNGVTSKKNCEVSCIACSVCAKNCPVKAITVANNLAVIDANLCINCGICELKCPTDAINSEIKEKRKAKINEDKCIGCMKCKNVCPTCAIEGDVKQKHKINREDCVGCGLCEEVCEVKAIIMDVEIVKQ